jgi:transcription-repair coupling factor (superfamily II helicase)
VRERAKSLIGRIPNADDMLESIANAIPVEGMESLMPALIDDMEPVAGLLPDNALMLLSDPEKLRRAAEDLTKTANEFLAASWHVAAAGHGAGAPISFEQASFLDYDETISALEFSRHEVIQLTSFGVDASRPGHVQLDAQDPAQFRGDEAKASHGIESLIADGYAVTVTSPAQGTLSRLKRVINETGITKFECIRSHAIDGFVDNAAKVALLTERDITGRTSAGTQAKTPKRRRKAIDLVELKTGDYIVHEQHGIGRFVEMKQRTIGVGANKTTREYLVIEYAPSKRNAPPDKLFIPTDQLDQVSKYIGAEAPKLNKLGGSDWAATKAKARKHVHEIAEDWSSSTRRGRARPDSPSAPTPRGRRSLRTPSPTRRPPTSSRPSTKSRPTWRSPCRWTGSSAATWASAKPKSRCGPPSRRFRTASRWPCWCRRPCWCSSITRPSPSATRASRSRWRR